MAFDKIVFDFNYDVNIREGGYTKGFIMYYMMVWSCALDDLKHQLKIKEGPRYKGLHLTIGNGKNNNIFPDWPRMIEIRSSINH